MHRLEPGQNFVIRAGFLKKCFHRVGNGLSILEPRPGPGLSGTKKIVTRVVTWVLTLVLTRLLPDYNPIVTHFHQIFILLKILSFPD